MPEAIRVVIVDDHAVVRQGLKSFLRVQDGIEFVGEAASGDEALVVSEAAAPDVILMDLVMPKTDGIETMHHLREAGSNARVIMLTSFAEDEQVVAAVKAGAAGYLLKDVGPEELASAIRAVYEGGARLHQSVASALVSEVAEGGAADARPDALTARELDVLTDVARGMSNKEIAADLGVAEKTVKSHMSSILRKLQLSDRTQAALYAVREHIVDLQ